MKLEQIDKNTLTLDQIIKLKKELYVIGYDSDLNRAGMCPLVDVISRVSDIFDGEHVVVRISMGNETVCQAPIKIDTEEELEPPVDKVRDKPLRTWERQSYKVNCIKKDGSIMLEGRPKGEIRVSFSDKEDAQAYFERIREIFYKNVSQADAISVDNLYAELGFTEEDLPSDYSKEEGDKWGYLTVEHGPIKYISEVSKTKNSKLWGFTVKRPIKIYGMTDTKWWEKHKKLQEEEYGESINSARMDGGLS